MGIADRDYVRQRAAPSSMGGAGIGQMSGWSVTTWLIAICVGVFVLDLLLINTFPYFRVQLLTEGGGFIETYITRAQATQLEEAGAIGRQIDVVGPIERWGFFSVDTSVFGGQLWRWISFQFLHAGGFHLFSNLIGLYFFGSMIEQYLGRRRFLAFYLLCGIAGPVIYGLFAAAGILSTTPDRPLIGASAGVFGVLAAGAIIAPNVTVQLLIPPIPLKLKTMALLLLAYAVVIVFISGPNAGGEAAHLGGAALGYLLIRHPNWLNWAEAGPSSGLPKPRGQSHMRYTG